MQKTSTPKLRILLSIFQIAIFTWVCFPGSLCAQDVIKPRPKASPLAMATYQGNENDYLKVTYGQPSKRGRDIFGNLVPYGSIWRTGANEATELTTTDDILIGGSLLKAGTYTLFTIPNQNKWTIIFNEVLGQWGAYKYEDYVDRNVLSFEVDAIKMSDIYEAFTILFEETKAGTDMLLLWDQTRVSIPIKMD